jgi:hypothetical protein
MRFLTQARGECVQAVGASSDQHQLMAAPRKLERDGLTYS